MTVQQIDVLNRNKDWIFSSVIDYGGKNDSTAKLLVSFHTPLSLLGDIDLVKLKINKYNKSL